MKKLGLFALIFGFSCSSAKITLGNENLNVKSKLETVCPEDGTCTLELLKNKRIAVKRDITGKLYYQLEDDANTSVIHYQYKRNTDPDLQDGQHREEVVFEIENTVSELQLRGEDLRQVKMIFGRHCFCRGQAGYFEVTKGSLDLQNGKDQLTFVVDYEITEVPQTLKELKGSFYQ